MCDSSLCIVAETKNSSNNLQLSFEMLPNWLCHLCQERPINGVPLNPFSARWTFNFERCHRSAASLPRTSRVNYHLSLLLPCVLPFLSDRPNEGSTRRLNKQLVVKRGRPEKVRSVTCALVRECGLCLEMGFSTKVKLGVLGVSVVLETARFASWTAGL